MSHDGSHGTGVNQGKETISGIKSEVVMQGRKKAGGAPEKIKTEKGKRNTNTRKHEGEKLGLLYKRKKGLVRQRTVDSTIRWRG